MEVLLKHGYSKDALAYANLILEQKYREHFPEIMDTSYYPKTPGFASEILSRYVKQYSYDHDEFEVLYTETSGCVSVGTGREIYFKVDSILKGTNGIRKDSYFSLEHKTSSSAHWLPHSLKVQIGTYSHVLYCLYGPSTYGVVINGAIFQKTKPSLIRLDMPKTPTQMQVWLATVNYWFDLIEREHELYEKEKDKDAEVMHSFPMNPESCQDYGRLCEYYDFCNAWGNPASRRLDTPFGFIIDKWDPRAQKTTHKMNLTETPKAPSREIQRLACDRWKQLERNVWRRAY
jgi:hypothetical protein